MLKSLAVANFVLDNNLPLLFSSGCLITCLWSVTVLGYGDVCLGLLCKAPICLLFKYRLLKQMNTCLNLRVFGLPGGTSMLECFNSMMFMLKDTPLSRYPPRSRAGEERSWCPRPGSRAPAPVPRVLPPSSTLIPKLVYGAPERARARKKMVMVKHAISDSKVDF